MFVCNLDPPSHLFGITTPFGTWQHILIKLQTEFHLRLIKNINCWYSLIQSRLYKIRHIFHLVLFFPCVNNALSSLISVSVPPHSGLLSPGPACHPHRLQSQLLWLSLSLTDHALDWLIQIFTMVSLDILFRAFSGKMCWLLNQYACFFSSE